MLERHTFKVTSPASPRQVENNIQYHPHFAAGEKWRHRDGEGPATEVDKQGTGWHSGDGILFPAQPLACWESLGSYFPSLYLFPFPPCVSLA